MAHLDSSTLGRALATTVFASLALIACDGDSLMTKQSELRVYLRGSTIMLDTSRSGPLWYMGCTHQFTISKAGGDALSDARKRTHEDGFYLDGKYEPFRADFCDDPLAARSTRSSRSVPLKST
jgi:hypothetical protein